MTFILLALSLSLVLSLACSLRYSKKPLCEVLYEEAQMVKNQARPLANSF